MSKFDELDVMSNDDDFESVARIAHQAEEQNPEFADIDDPIQRVDAIVGTGLFDQVEVTPLHLRCAIHRALTGETNLQMFYD